MNEHELLVPFVACESQGGPYNDLAFAAGFEAGKVDEDNLADIPDLADQPRFRLMAAVDSYQAGAAYQIDGSTT